MPVSLDPSLEALRHHLHTTRLLGSIHSCLYVDQNTVMPAAGAPWRGEQLALKWYLPACISRDRGLAERLRQSISLGAPNGDFLWPLALVMRVLALAVLAALRNNPALRAVK